MSEQSKILEEANNLIHKSRNDVYGDAFLDFSRIGKVWGALLDIEDIPAHTVGAMLAGMKLVRTQISPDHRDSWVDGAAYPALGWYCWVRDGQHITE